MRSNLLLFLIGSLLCCCKRDASSDPDLGKELPLQYMIVLGIAQDGGYPHINNIKEYKALKNNLINKKLVVSLGIVDQEAEKKFLIEATPDMPEQLANLSAYYPDNPRIIDGVFLTHAHIGHYTGLMYFGREAMGAKNIPVHVMPKMQGFLENNGPWSQLVDVKNIQLFPLAHERTQELTPALKITPFRVPHRDEFSETVGYKIEGAYKSALFIPDINKWSQWSVSIKEQVEAVDYALIDATFYEEGEIPRPMSEVPHPFIEETLDIFKDATSAVKSKIYFIHFNHSNPMLNADHTARKKLEAEGYNFTYTNQILPL
ncbi:MBL fold metallo-hydrolase [Aquimarina sp. 2-A2]|uniref:MBL fold metallo-hydrolase n=1 Tax=Aquimarina sp. 2-A2 TaxID=3382644 RepID=UPI00387F25CD